MLWVRITLRQSVLDASLCDKVSHWLEEGWWFSQGTPVSSTKKTYRHNITEILLNVALNTIILTPSMGMVRNSTNINKTNSYLSPQLIEHKKDHNNCQWKSRFWLETGTKNVWVKPVKNLYRFTSTQKVHILSHKGITT